MSDKKPNTLALTPIGRLSFPFLFTPDEKGKYRTTLIFGKNDDLSAIEEMIQAAAEKKWGKGKMPKRTKLPIHSNEDAIDKEGNRRAGYEDSEGRHVRFWTTRSPKIVGRDKDPQTGRFIELTKDELWAGCYCRISFSAYAGEHAEGGPYVALIMQNVQLMKEGESLAGIVSEPEADFDDDVLAAIAD